MSNSFKDIILESNGFLFVFDVDGIIKLFNHFSESTISKFYQTYKGDNIGN